MFELLLFFKKVEIIILSLMTININVTVASTPSLSPSLSSSPLTVQYYQTDMDLCGKQRVTLGYKHPEHVIKFPYVTATKSAGIRKHVHLGRSFAVPHDSEEEEEIAQQDLYANNDDFVYHCEWLIITDSYHTIGGKIKIDNESGYFLSITDQNGLITNCTSKSCTFESETPVVQLRFHARQVNSQPATRLSAKFFTSPIYSDRGGAAIIALWILLIALTAVLIVLASIVHLFCMKRKLLFSRILTILRLKNNKTQAESKKKKITLPNGTKVTLANCPRQQQRCSVPTVQFNSFERMPTILEETENDSESRASSRQLNETLRKISSHRDCNIIPEKSGLPQPPTSSSGGEPAAGRIITRTETMASCS